MAAKAEESMTKESQAVQRLIAEIDSLEPIGNWTFIPLEEKPVISPGLLRTTLLLCGTVCGIMIALLWRAFS